MKEICSILPRINLLFLLLVFQSCSDPWEKGLPVVETISVAPNGYRNIALEGRIVEEGTTPVICYGFFYSEAPELNEWDNQIYLNRDGLAFQGQLENLTPGKLYYFRSFAANQLGYSYGNTISLLIPDLPPPVPCQISPGQLTEGNSTRNISSVVTNQLSSEFQVVVGYQSGFSYREITLSFDQEPQNGLYLTGNSGAPGTSQVDVRLNTGISTYGLSQNDTVFVSLNPDNTTSIEFCPLMFNIPVNPSIQAHIRY